MEGHSAFDDSLPGAASEGVEQPDAGQDTTNTQPSETEQKESKSPVVRLIKKALRKKKTNNPASPNKPSKKAKREGANKASRHGKGQGPDAGDDEDSITLLSGETAFITLDYEPVEGMEKIAERKAFSPLNKGYYKRESRKLSVYVYPETRQRHGKVKLAVDGYLRLGMRRSLAYRDGPIVLLGGDESEESINIEVLVFSRGEIREVVERQLPPRTALDFEDMIDGVIDNLQNEYPGARIIQAAPLGRFHHEAIKEYLDENIFKRTGTIELQPSDSAVRLYGPPILLAVLAAGYYAFTVVSGFGQHARLVEDVRDLQDQLRQLTQNEVSIDVLEAREQFKIANDSDESEDSHVYHIKSLAQAAGAVKDAEIRRLRTPGDRGTIAELSLAMPVGDYPSPLIQGRHLLDELVYHSEGYSMRLSQTRPSESSDDAIIFHIEVINGQ